MLLRDKVIVISGVGPGLGQTLAKWRRKKALLSYLAHEAKIFSMQWRPRFGTLAARRSP